MAFQTADLTICKQKNVFKFFESTHLLDRKGGFHPTSSYLGKTDGVVLVVCHAIMQPFIGWWLCPVSQPIIPAGVRSGVTKCSTGGIWSPKLAHLSCHHMPLCRQLEQSNLWPSRLQGWAENLGSGQWFLLLLLSLKSLVLSKLVVPMRTYSLHQLSERFPLWRDPYRHQGSLIVYLKTHNVSSPVWTPWDTTLFCSKCWPWLSGKCPRGALHQWCQCSHVQLQDHGVGSHLLWCCPQVPFPWQSSVALVWGLWCPHLGWLMYQNTRPSRNQGGGPPWARLVVTISPATLKFPFCT